MSGLKKPSRAVEKALRNYGGDATCLLDICRDGMVFDDLADLCTTLRSIHRDPDIKVVRIKNRLDDEYEASVSAGYRDVMLNLCIQTPETCGLNVQHHIAELQLIPGDVYKRRTRSGSGHKNYVEWRNLRGS